MSYEWMKIKKYYYFLAIRDIVRLFGEQELCTECEINVPAVVDYVNSFNFNIDTWEVANKEEIYQKVTDDILNGYPIWRLLDIPEYKMNILERELSRMAEEELERLKKTYKCYTCKYFEEIDISIGIDNKCHWEPPEKSDKAHGHRFKLKRWDDEPFKPKKRCKNYDRVDDE